ncbi:MAG: hypothetical protein H6826_14515 [Planctomycetes bacterium]|nr:hypothetical protein [Planctomycetota bacterium]
MDGDDRTVFHVTADGVELEFEGTEEFVTRQVERFRGFLERAIGFAATGQATLEAPDVVAAHTPASIVAFSDFAAANPVRDGRGAIQERILMAIYHMEHNVGRPGATTDDISFCFSQAGWEEPGSLHNHLGILKRKKGLLDDSAGRGLYRLSAAGSDYCSHRFR